MSALTLAEVEQLDSPVEEELFYIQNIGFIGNSLRFWRPDGQGYTTDLDDAWKVSAKEAAGITRVRRDEDFAHPVKLLDSLATRQVNCEALWLHQRKQGVKT